MISQQTIDRVFEEAQCVDIVGQFVDLKKAGANYKGFSPFVKEKTPSFIVSPAKNIYKCFSSGQGGTAIGFLMDAQGMTYPEAVEYAAAHYNIPVIKEEAEQNAEVRDHLVQLDKTLRAANRAYQKELFSSSGLPVHEELFNKRQWSKDTVLQWGLGFAPDAWRFLTDKVVNIGLFEVARELGLTNHKNGNNFDTYRNRIIFPIHNHHDKLVGFGARDLGPGECTGKTPPKYLNSPDSKIYKKEHVLYGLNHAARIIREAGFAYITEGYADVISMHQAGLSNTVATCGTALTAGHLKLLGRYTKHLVLLYDGDAAGQRATEKAVFAAAEQAFKIEVVPLDKDHDPDSLCRMFSQEIEA